MGGQPRCRCSAQHAPCSSSFLIWVPYDPTTLNSSPHPLPTNPAGPLTAGKGADSHLCSATAGTGGSASLDVLLRRSDQLCFGSGGEQDRSRLIKVHTRVAGWDS